MLHTDLPLPCSADPELWFKTSKRAVAKAKDECRGCAVKFRCLEDALETEKLMGQQLHGVHGGLTRKERSKLISVTRIA